jgi:hypothetical protein
MPDEMHFRHADIAMIAWPELNGSILEKNIGTASDGMSDQPLHQPLQAS